MAGKVRSFSSQGICDHKDLSGNERVSAIDMVEYVITGRAQEVK